MEQMIKIFENEEFGRIRIVVKDGEPWFVGKDVASILEYRNGSRDINRHVDEEDRRKIMIESNGSEGCVINNRTDGKKSTAMNMYAFRITQADVKFTVTKVLSTDNSVKISGTSPIDNSKAIYGVYSDKECKNKVGEITIGADGTGSITLPNKQYYGTFQQRRRNC